MRRMPPLRWRILEIRHRHAVNAQRCQRAAAVPVILSNLNLFADLSTNQNPCPNFPSDVGFQPLATNADGSTNSCTNPAQAGSTVSFFAHGAGGFESQPSRLVNLHASFGFGCTALVTNVSLIAGLVYKMDVSLPASLAPCDQVFKGQ